MYFKGKGVPKDYSKAGEWYIKSAKQGHAGALYQLAVMHMNGYGVEKDVFTGNVFFVLSAKEGHVSAQKIVEELTKNLSIKQIAVIELVAEKFYEDATPAQIETRKKLKRENKELQKKLEKLKKTSP